MILQGDKLVTCPAQKFKPGEANEQCIFSPGHTTPHRFPSDPPMKSGERRIGDQNEQPQPSRPCAARCELGEIDLRHDVIRLEIKENGIWVAYFFHDYACVTKFAIKKIEVHEVPVK